MKEFKPLFFNYLLKVQEGQSGMIPPDLDIPDVYRFHRVGRSGAVTNARNLGVDSDDINFFLFWRQTEQNLGRSINHSKMVNYYTDISQSLPLLLRCTGGRRNNNKRNTGG